MQKSIFGLPVRHALRGIRRNRGYAAAVIVSLALGLGVNTALFMILETTLLRPLPYPDASRLVVVGTERPARPGSTDGPSTSWVLYARDLRDWRRSAPSLSASAVASFGPNTIVGDAGAEYRTGARASADLLDVLGIHPMLGRWYGEAESDVVVLSYALWRRQFHGDSAVLGRTLRVRERPHRVIGVMPPGPAFPAGAEYWTPLPTAASTATAGGSRMMVPGEEGEVVARLRPGVTATQATLALNAHWTQTGHTRSTIRVISLHDRLLGPAKPALRLLFGAALVLLLIACANVANLSLARAVGRHHEFTLRTALGASRRSLLSLVLAENALLAVVGAAAAVLLAGWCARVAVALGPEELSRMGQLRTTSWGLIFAGGAAALAVVVSSVASVVAVPTHGLRSRVGAIAPNLGARTSRRVRRAVVVVQLAAALVLSIGAGLAVHSIANLTDRNHLGFSSHGIVLATFRLSGSSYRGPETHDRFINELTRRVKTLPGVEGVAIGAPPLVAGTGDGFSEGFDALTTWSDGRGPGARHATVWVKFVDPGYLETYGIRLRQGRNFGPGDDGAAPPVAIVNAAAAALMFPDKAALDRDLPIPTRVMGKEGPPARVVGVADDVLQQDVTVPAHPEVLFPIAQHPSCCANLAVRVSGDPEPIITSIREIVRSIDPTLAATRLETMDAVISTSLSRQRFLLLLLGVFAVLGLTVAGTGLYAITAYYVNQRTAEIGVRMALGAQGAQVVRLVLREGLALAALGVAIGIPVALALGRVTRSFIYEITLYDPVTFGGTLALLTLIALAAAYIPARRAARLDPVQALRVE